MVVFDNHPGEGIWYVVVNYGILESRYRFGTAGGTQHITQSHETVGSWARPGETAPDFKGAIGVTSDSVQGVDVPVPAREWTEAYMVADALVTEAYKDLLESLTYCVNTETFEGFDAGQVRFEGATLETQGYVAVEGVATPYWQLTLAYKATPNRTYVTIGDIDGISKEGWDYLWVRYEDQVDESGKEVIKIPKAVYVDRVLYRGDLNEIYVFVEEE